MNGFNDFNQALEEAVKPLVSTHIRPVFRKGDMEIAEIREMNGHPSVEN